MRYFITGGCGFLGSNLAHEVLSRGDELFILDNLSREGTPKNLEWLKTFGKFEFYHQDIKDFDRVEKVIKDIKPDVVFHLAGQVAMTTSIQDPRRDFETNVVGGHNVLESVRRHAPHAILTYSSTNKVYGDFEWVRFEEQETRYIAPDYPQGFDEKAPLEFQSPYGCSKGATDQYMLDYARLFGVRSIVFRHSTIFGGRQFATFDQGWVGWFIEQAVKGNSFTISGTGKQVRDVLFASDLIDCYFGAIKSVDKTKGQVFNMGGGMKNSLSLLELFSILERVLGRELKYTKLPWRAADQKIFVADTSKAHSLFGFEAKVDKMTGIKKMIEWVKEQ